MSRKQPSKAAQEQFQKLLLQETCHEAAGVVDDIRFAIQTSGAEITIPLELNEAGLDQVERFYRHAVAGGRQIEFGTENFERLMALMLGQCLVQAGKGEWHIYTGRYHVLTPIVIQLATGKHVNVFSYCTGMSRKQMLGTRRMQSLSDIVRNVERLAFPQEPAKSRAWKPDA